MILKVSSWEQLEFQSLENQAITSNHTSAACLRHFVRRKGPDRLVVVVFDTTEIIDVDLLCKRPGQRGVGGWGVGVGRGAREWFLCTLGHVLISGMHICEHCFSGRLRDFNYIFQIIILYKY